MKVKAHLRNLRISPRKVRLLADLIRRKTVVEARTQLSFSAQKSATPLLKLLKSAVANAQHNYHMDPATLTVDEIFVDQGFALKRIMPRAMGRAAQFKRMMSHVTIVLAGVVTEKATKTTAKEKEEKTEKVTSADKQAKTKVKKEPVKRSTSRKASTTKK